MNRLDTSPDTRPALLAETRQGWRTALEIVYGDGLRLLPLPYVAAGAKLCGGCEVAPGHEHKLGCPREMCPRCGGRLASCECGGRSPSRVWRWVGVR